jgi:hypothetical protein
MILPILAKQPPKKEKQEPTFSSSTSTERERERLKKVVDFKNSI